MRSGPRTKETAPRPSTGKRRDLWLWEPKPEVCYEKRQVLLARQDTELPKQHRPISSPGEAPVRRKVLGTELVQRDMTRQSSSIVLLNSPAWVPPGISADLECESTSACMSTLHPSLQNFSLSSQMKSPSTQCRFPFLGCPRQATGYPRGFPEHHEPLLHSHRLRPVSFVISEARYNGGQLKSWSDPTWRCASAGYGGFPVANLHLAACARCSLIRSQLFNRSQVPRWSRSARGVTRQIITNNGAASTCQATGEVT